MTAIAIAPARRLLVRRPEAWLYGFAAFAWLVLVLAAPGGGGHVGHAHPGAEAGTVAGAWPMWGAMVVAMMLPVVAPAARQVALRSLWHRRHRALAGFVLGYLAVWLAVGGVFVAVVRVPLAIVLLAAALWQVAPARRRAMRRCGALPPCALRDRDCVEAGVRLGGRCVFTCAPVMAAMAGVAAL